MLVVGNQIKEYMSNSTASGMWQAVINVMC